MIGSGGKDAALGRLTARQLRRVRETGASSGFAPSAVIAQLIFNPSSGDCSLADAERLGEDQVPLERIGLARAADQTTLGEFLRAQTEDSVLLPLRNPSHPAKPPSQASSDTCDHPDSLNKLQANRSLRIRGRLPPT